MTRRRVGIGSALVVGMALVASSCGFGWTGPVDQLSDHQARLSGRVGSLTLGDMTFHFEYGTTDAYGSSTTPRTFPITDIHYPLDVKDVVQGLTADTEYHYRLCAVDVDGNGSCGGDQTFTTNAGHDSVTGFGAILISDGIYNSTSAYVNATADVDGSGAFGRAGYTPSVPTATKPSFEGDVTCLRVEGNRASIGLLAVAPGFGIVAPVVMFIEDGAATGTPDRMAIKGVDVAPTTCPAPTDADFTPITINYPWGPVNYGPQIGSGDFVVEDGS